MTSVAFKNNNSSSRMKIEGLIFREPDLNYIYKTIKLPSFKRKTSEDDRHSKKRKVEEGTSIEAVETFEPVVGQVKVVSTTKSNIVSITDQLLEQYADTSKFPHKLKSVFGEFRCNDCKRSWSSGHAWIRMGCGLTQKCRQCKTAIVPFKIRHKKKGGRKNHGPHDQSGCQVCLEFDEPCWEIQSKKDQ